MSDNEIEDVSFLPGVYQASKAEFKANNGVILNVLEGESLHRKAVYEPSIIQRVKLFACSRGRLAVIVTITCLVILVFALLIAISTNKNDVKTYPHYPGVLPTAKPTKPSEDYISTSGKPFPYRAIRLPDSIIPTHYSIFLHPNITESYFKGSVEISCDVKQTASYIVFHIKDLNITSLTLTLTDSTNAHVYNIKEYLEYKKNEQVYVSLGERLTPGSKVVLKVSFEGQLISKLAGFYKSMYKTNAGEKRYIATTHFEPTDARAAFPCFDEPALKATFELTMIRDKNYYSLFNMPLLSSSGYHDNLVQDKFQTSVKMSTYLVAFIVCDYESITNKTKRNVTVGVHAPKDSIGAAEFALSAAVKIIDYYEEYFGVEYPLPKQDLVAIPDFAAGAMENWGLITYRMTAILYDPKVSSAHYQQWVAVVIAHELAHQWFGNLVTMAWWDDLWLNEGFASYVEYIGSTQVNPGWKMEDQFVIDTQLRAEYLDCMKNSHPINLPVENPNQINELFDSITYDKGASIIRMLSQYLGEETFKAGLTSYLNRYRYNNAVTNDLWDSLSEASSHTASKSDHGTAVQSLMKTWTEQMGYPLITMERKGNTVTMTQSRFLLDTTSNTTEKYPSPFGYMWEVPFAYRTSKSPNNVQKILLKDKTGSFQLEEGTGWVQGNAEMYGYYRVNYDSSGWEAIIKELNRYPKTFSTTERAGLIDDAFMLARAGQLPYATVFTMLEYMVHEEDYLPWYSLMSNIVYVQRRLEEKPVYTQYKSYLLKLMKSQLDQVVWEDTGTHLQKYLRSQILSKAMDLGDKESIDKGRELFKNWKSDHTKINVNLKSVIYLAGIRYGDEADWTTVWQAYQVENDASEKRALLGALGQTRDTGLIMRLLSYSIDDNLVRSQDTEGVVSSVAGTPAGQVLSWRFLQQNWDLFHKRYAGTSFIMNRLIKSTCSRFDTQFDYNEVENFFAIRDAGSGTMAVQQTLESIHMNIDWSTRYEKEVTDWLQKHGQ